MKLPPHLGEHWKAVFEHCLKGGDKRCDESRYVRATVRNLVKWEIRNWLAENGSIGGLLFYCEDTGSKVLFLTRNLMNICTKVKHSLTRHLSIP